MDEPAGDREIKHLQNEKFATHSQDHKGESSHKTLIFPDQAQLKNRSEKPLLANEKDLPIGSSATPPSPPLPNFLQFITDPANGGSVVEQAWMIKMAGEIARRYQQEREKGGLGADGDAPPAYAG